MTKYERLEKQNRKLKRFLIAAVILLFLISAGGGIIIYTNYNYLVFKYLMTSRYLYTTTLDELIQQELKRDADKKYYSCFDNTVISIMTRSIRSLNNDRYTYLYFPEKFKKASTDKKSNAALSEVKYLTRDIAYLKLTNFTKYSRNFVEDSLKELRQYPGLIIDLRDNPGGDSMEMNKMAGYFLPSGSLIATDKLRKKDLVHKSDYKYPLTPEKIIILQNKSTASASENFAAALRDNLKTVSIIGETSYGKGIGQLTVPLKGGYAIKLTTMEWLTPKSVNIQDKGIEPDIRYTGEDIIQFALKTFN